MVEVTSAALGAVAFAALLAVAEAVARWWIRRTNGYYRYRPHWRERLLLDREALPGLPPVVHVVVNRDGERGDPPPPRNARAFRALVVGGSAAECYFLDQGSTWAAVAQRILNQPEGLAALGADRAHIGNISRAILPCEHIHTLLRRTLPRYERLDAVLVMVGGSDLVRWLERKMPSSIADGVVPPSSVFEVHPEGPWGARPSQTALWRLAAEVRRRRGKRVVERPDAGAWLHRVRAMRAAATSWVDESADPAPMLDHFARHLRGIIETARTKAARVVLVRQPWFQKEYTSDEQKLLWSFALGRPYKEQVDRYCTPELAWRLMVLVDARAVEVASQLGIEHVHAMPLLEQSARTFYDELHLTPAGAEVVGAAVAEQLMRPRPPR